MRKIIPTLATAAMLAVSFVPVTTGVSHAGLGEVVKLNGQGFRKCKAQGKTGFTGIVRGRSLNIARNTGDFGTFNVRSCFQTKAQCAKFVRSIPRVVPGVFDIHYSSCNSRG